MRQRVPGNDRNGVKYGVLLAGLGAWLASTTIAMAGEAMSVADAHRLASEGRITLVDVRTPEEWKETGVPASGYAISMHQPGADFLRGLDAALGGDRNKPLAIICRTGNRTGSIVIPLEKAGFKHVIDVAEGMAGGRHGSGWVKTGLPVRPWSPGRAAPVVAGQ